MARAGDGGPPPRQHLIALLAYGGLSLAMFGPWILGRMSTLAPLGEHPGRLDLRLDVPLVAARDHPRDQPAAHDRCVGAHGDQPGLGHLAPLPAVALSPVTGQPGPSSPSTCRAAAPALAAWTAYLLCRHPAGAFLPALAGGFFFGFSPYLIDEFGMGHPNLSLVFLVPLAAYLVVRLLDGSLPARLVIPLLGVVLGAQLYISTETFATLTLMGGLFALIGLAARPAWRHRLRAAIGPVAGAYAVAAVLGIPLFYAAAAWPRPYKPILFATIGHGAQSGATSCAT